MRCRSLYTALIGLTLVASAASATERTVAVPMLATDREVEVASYSAPTLARPSPMQALVASVAKLDGWVLTNSESARVATAQGFDLWVADEPLRRQVVKPDATGTLYANDSTASALDDMRWRGTSELSRRILLRI